METERMFNEMKKLTVLIENSTSKISKLLASNKKPNQWLYGSEVKELLRISESTLRRMRLENRIPYKKIGRTYNYPSIFFEKILLNKAKKRYGKEWDDE
jgi:hypothetical protein